MPKCKWLFNHVINCNSIKPAHQGVYCKGLTLPSTELLHSADLVCILPSYTRGDGSSISSVSILSVSPEGLVRYWPNLVHDGTTVDMNTDLVGVHCHSLSSFQVRNQSCTVQEEMVWIFGTYLFDYRSTCTVD